MPPSPGRPRRASRELLQEAAFELFQLRGYRRTSVEQIARTAGFSRATFFNFFSSKAELFWLETDALIASLREFLGERAGRVPLRETLLEFAGTLSAASIPWALQNFRLIEAADDLVASGAGRVLGLNELFRAHLEGGAEREDPGSPRTEAAVLTALLLTALLGWIEAGVGRGDFRGHLERVLRSGA